MIQEEWRVTRKEIHESFVIEMIAIPTFLHTHFCVNFFFRTEYYHEGDEILNNIITGYPTWYYCYDLDD